TRAGEVPTHHKEATMAIYRQYYVDFGKGMPGWFVEITALDGQGREIELWDGAAWPTPDSPQCASKEWRALTREERAEILAALDRAPARDGRSRCGRFRAAIREAAVPVAVPVLGFRPGSWRREKLAVIDGE